MKRIVSVLTMLLAVACFADGAGMAPVNPAFLKWKARKEKREAQKKAAQTNQVARPVLTTANTVTSDDKEDVDYGYIPPLFDRSYLANINNGAKKAISQESFASVYDLRTLGRLTPIKNQNPYGTCWAHATMASLESWLLTSEGVAYDFSENNLANLHGGDWGFNDGGNGDRASAYLLRWSGPVLESEDPYPNWGGSKALSPCRHVQRIRWLIPKNSGAALDNDEIKAAIVKYGAVYASYYHSGSYYNSTYKSYYHPSATSGNHAVAIVGWDDTYSSSKFTQKPSGNGAFIVRNSWGTSWGENGYFYVSYYDNVLGHEELYAFCSAEDTANYTKIYQYDPLGMVAGWRPYSSLSSVYCAAVFSVTSADNIRAVGFYAMAPNTPYTISVRSGVSAGKPTSGTLALSQSGVVDDAGFITVPLTDFVAIESGTRFSVVVKITPPSGCYYPVAIEYCYPGYTSAATASSGQTFVSANGSSWTDCYSVNSTWNICLKAYAKTGTITKTLTDINCYSSDNSTKVASGKSKQFTCKATYSDGSEKEVKPTWSITSGGSYGSISSSGLFTAASVTSAQDVGVKASYTEGGITKTSSFTVTITVSAPNAPTGLTATAGTESSCVRLAWTAASGATGYTVYRATGSNANSSSAKSLGRVDQPKYADTAATPGVDYTYFVKAKNGSGTSGFSAGASGWRALAAPSDVTASDGTSTDCVKVGWEEVSGASVYRVYRGTDEDNLSVLSGWITDLSYSDTTAVAGTLYYYAVKAALDTAGTRASELSIADTGIREKANLPESMIINGPSALASGAQGSYTASVRWSNGNTTTATPTWTCDGKTSTVTPLVYTAPVVSASKTVTLTAKATVESVALTASYTITVSPSISVAPSAPTITSKSTSGIALSWSAVSGASSYIVYRGTTTDASSASKVGTVTSTTFTDTSVTPGQTVYYFLAAVNTAGTSALSVASAAAVRTLAAPTGVTASNGTYTDKVRVTWSAVLGASYYRVSRATSLTGSQTDLGSWQTGTTYEDTSATAGTTYYYFVRAATSSSGASVSAKSSPGAKGLRKVAVTLSSLAISGADRVNAGSTAVYAAKATYSDGTSKTVSPTWSIASGSGATIDSAGKLTASSVTADATVTIQASFTDGGVTKTATKSVAIIAPRVATVSVSNVKATSRWPWKQIVDVDYTITASPADTKAKVTVEARDEDRLQDLKPMALSGDGATGSVGAGSHRISWNVAEDYPNFNASKVSIDVKASVASVGAPTNPSASAGTYADKVVVSWTAVDDATGYEVWRSTTSSTNSATKLGTVETTSYSDTSATAGMTYYYWVKSKDDSSTSEFSTVITGYRNVAAPSSVTATVATSTANVTISWSATTGALKYEIYRGTSSAFTSATKLITTTSTSYADTSATPGTNYYYWVKAICSQGTGTVSSYATGRRLVSAPTNLTASDGTSTTSVSLSWTAATGASSYQIWRGTSSSSSSATKIGTATTTSYTDSTATPGVTYYYWVKTVDASGSASAFGASDTGYVKQIVLSTTYVVVDLSGGTTATSYPVTELVSVPSGGWTDEYKTTKLVLRRIPAGSFTMGGRSTDYPNASDSNLHSVSLTKSFYMGVFEVTQRQWELVMGTKPSYFSNASCYTTRPVEQVSYNDIRGSSSGAGWPSSSAVDATSFLGKIRAKTGFEGFDLPTEGQWVYACRAGTTTALNSGKNLTSTGQDANMAEVGRYYYNGGSSDSSSGDTTVGTAKVGSYAPNAWGLYDMHGNVWERCLDWYASLGTSAVTDPVGATSGSDRLLRGGGWYGSAQNCRSANRSGISRSSRYYGWGFRLSLRDIPTASDSVTVAFDANGGLTVVSSQTYAVGSTYSSLPAATRDGYYFAGWFTAASGGTPITQYTTVDGAMTKLYAHWTTDKEYLVIDLSGGTNATSYAVSYLASIPSGGWADEYKTTKLVLRRIEAGTFTMGSPSDEVGRDSDEDQHVVTLTKPFYMGVFEVTQGQWELVMGTRPSYFTNMYYATRPVERVSYNDIRGSAEGTKWPSSSAVDTTSFLGKLRIKACLTGLDLPTEAQWEYACRAGTTTALNSGKNLTNTGRDSNMAEVGRYETHEGSFAFSYGRNSDLTAKIGSYAPNAWGLYDMHGNVWELCLDWYVSALGASSVTDCVGAASGSDRVLRGGCWSTHAQWCRSASRISTYPSGVYNVYGFRLSLH